MHRMRISRSESLVLCWRAQYCINACIAHLEGCTVNGAETCPTCDSLAEIAMDAIKRAGLEDA